MKKLLSSLTIATTLLFSATAALADTKVADHRGARPDERMLRPAPDMIRDNVVDAKRAFGRRGTVTLTAQGFGKQGDMFVLSSDSDLDIRFVKVTYARGRSVMLRGSNARAIDLPDSGRIQSVEVSYVNRGARGASIKLVAKANHTRPQPPHRGGGNHGGGNHGGGFGFR
ncbi:MAG TPA: hypothetical protein VM261_01200 [Kofleriaceae bacterium]|nr:hypothetical protein [Kofleriaceae bacterium]